MDTRLGAKVRSTPINFTLFILTGVILVVVGIFAALYMATAGIVGAMLVGGFGLIPVGFALTLAVISLIIERLNTLTIYERGFVKKNWGKDQMVLWDDITGVQCNYYSETAYVSAKSPYILPLGIFIVYSLGRPASTYTRTVSYYGFAVSDGRSLAFDNELEFDMLDRPVRDQVLPRLVESDTEQFRRGGDVELAGGLKYSQTGIQGVFERKAGRAYLKTPVDLKWEQVKEIRRFDQTMKIDAEGGKNVVLRLADMWNLKAFVLISKEQAEKYHFKHGGF